MTADQLKTFLKDELGYCNCLDPDGAMAVLRETLALARERTDAAARDDQAACAAVERKLEARLDLEGDASALAAWFLHGLEARGLVWHGFRATDLWINDKGRAVLAAIEASSSSEPRP